MAAMAKSHTATRSNARVACDGARNSTSRARGSLCGMGPCTAHRTALWNQETTATSHNPWPHHIHAPCLRGEQRQTGRERDIDLVAAYMPATPRGHRQRRAQGTYRFDPETATASDGLRVSPSHSLRRPLRGVVVSICDVDMSDRCFAMCFAPTCQRLLAATDTVLHSY